MQGFQRIIVLYKGDLHSETDLLYCDAESFSTLDDQMYQHLHFYADGYEFKELVNFNSDPPLLLGSQEVY